jgi:hypothetical protein
MLSSAIRKEPTMFLFVFRPFSCCSLSIASINTIAQSWQKNFFYLALFGAWLAFGENASVSNAIASAQAPLGTTREDVLGRPLWRGAPQVVSTALYQAIQQTRQTRTPAEVEYVSPAHGMRNELYLMREAASRGKRNGDYLNLRGPDQRRGRRVSHSCHLLCTSHVPLASAYFETLIMRQMIRKINQQGIFLLS